MTTFRVHFTLDGVRTFADVRATTPTAAKAVIIERHEGKDVRFEKIKRLREPEQAH